MTVTDEPKEELVRDPAIRQMIADYPDLPEFLVLKGRTDEERRAEWADFPVTVQGSNQSAADRAERGRSIAAAMEDERRAHNARGLARIKERHRGEKYDRKTRTWVPVGEDVQRDRHAQRVQEGKRDGE